MDIQESLNKFDQLIKDIDDQRPINAEQEARVLAKFRLEWNYHSNAIEGNSLSFGETKAFLLHGITAKGKPFKDYLDIKGHDHVIELLADLVRNNEELTESLIRELHRLLLVEPYVESHIGSDGVKLTRRIEIGRYKSSVNHIVSARGQTHYFATPEDTPIKMAELVSWYRQERDKKVLHPLVMASVFHHRFVAIHPFDDGNGRMARILTNLILMQAGCLPIILRTEKRNEYFLALANGDAGDMSDFILFIANAAIEVNSTFLHAAKGESVDELGDFDKKLQLLTQSLADSSDLSKGQRTQDIQNSIIQNFIVPLFRDVGDRFRHFETVFAKNELNIFWDFSGNLRQAKEGSLQTKIQEIQAKTVDQLIDHVVFHYEARAFKKDAGKNFLYRIEVFFHPTSFSLTLNRTGKIVGQVFQSFYTDPPLQAEAETLAKLLLTEMVQGFEGLIS